MCDMGLVEMLGKGLACDKANQHSSRVEARFSFMLSLLRTGNRVSTTVMQMPPKS
jgi:hypothetical protein